MTQQNELHAAVTVSPVDEPAATASAWQPLRQRVFRMLWLATVVSNVGSWMSDIGVNWTMLSLSADPLAVALVQAASSLPMFLFVLPAGVLADIVERRKILLFAQAWTFCAAGGLALLSFTDHVTPEILLAATFLLSTGAALSSPAFQAVVPDLVDKHELSPAIALNSLGINISRAIGPALGGLLLSFAGPWMVFLLNALSVMGVAFVLLRWQPQVTIQRLPPEHFFSAIRGGLRYVHAAPVLRNVLARTVAFFLFGSAGWAMLPLVARRELGLGPGGYGLMLACIGFGAICGAVLLPKLRKRLNADQMMVAASLLFAATMLALAFVRQVWLLNACEFFTGFAWIAVLSTLNVGAQRSAARWVKARALAVYLTVFFGSMTVGSAIWGKLASEFGVSWALCAATVGMVLASASVLRWRLEKDAALDLDIIAPTAQADLAIPHERGPVMVSCEYRVAPQEAHDFVAAMQEMRRVRRRTGAMGWGVYEDAHHPGLFVETWVMGSWIEHLRQHERHTVNDKLIRERVLAFHQGDEPPVIRHLVAPALR
ncbi:MFS transporter [Enterobacter sp. Bisph1]|uniref:MFS transporter n=1 Tax=Enterobacter sp. Bisph1 TaxID=1274399 RepID=UPI00057C1E17|nr:MFS transporter [Enterobacter sp. Bisph1]